MINIAEYVKCMRDNIQLPFPWVIQLEITDICPFSCPQCYKNKQCGKEMNFQKLVQLLDEYSKMGTKLFVLNGGEPLLYYKIVELIKRISNMPVSVNCFTSGFGLTEEIIGLWNFEKDKLCLSLNGSIEKVNSMSRVGYDVTLSAMKMLKEKKKKYGINWVASSRNVYDFKNMLELCDRMKVGFLFITCEKTTGNGIIPETLSEEQLRFLKEAIRTYQGDMRIYIESCYVELNNANRINKSGNYFIGCFAGKFGCHVDMEGNFSPCTHINEVEVWDSINDYWNKSETIKRLNANVKDRVMPCMESR